MFVFFISSLYLAVEDLSLILIKAIIADKFLHSQVPSSPACTTASTRFCTLPSSLTTSSTPSTRCTCSPTCRLRCVPSRLLSRAWCCFRTSSTWRRWQHTGRWPSAFCGCFWCACTPSTCSGSTSFSRSWTRRSSRVSHAPDAGLCVAAGGDDWVLSVITPGTLQNGGGDMFNRVKIPLCPCESVGQLHESNAFSPKPYPHPEPAPSVANQGTFVHVVPDTRGCHKCAAIRRQGHMLTYNAPPVSPRHRARGLAVQWWRWGRGRGQESEVRSVHVWKIKRDPPLTAIGVHGVGLGLCGACGTFGVISMHTPMHFLAEETHRAFVFIKMLSRGGDRIVQFVYMESSVLFCISY